MSEVLLRRALMKLTDEQWEEVTAADPSFQIFAKTSGYSRVNGGHPGRIAKAWVRMPKLSGRMLEEAVDSYVEGIAEVLELADAAPRTTDDDGEAHTFATALGAIVARLGRGPALVCLARTGSRFSRAEHAKLLDAINATIPFTAEGDSAATCPEEVADLEAGIPSPGGGDEPESVARKQLLVEPIAPPQGGPRIEDLNGLKQALVGIKVASAPLQTELDRASQAVGQGARTDSDDLVRALAAWDASLEWLQRAVEDLSGESLAEGEITELEEALDRTEGRLVAEALAQETQAQEKRRAEEEARLATLESDMAELVSLLDAAVSERTKEHLLVARAALEQDIVDAKERLKSTTNLRGEVVPHFTPGSPNLTPEPQIASDNDEHAFHPHTASSISYAARSAASSPAHAPSDAVEDTVDITSDAAAPNNPVSDADSDSTAGDMLSEAVLTAAKSTTHAAAPPSSGDPTEPATSEARPFADEQVDLRDHKPGSRQGAPPRTTPSAVSAPEHEQVTTVFPLPDDVGEVAAQLVEQQRFAAARLVLEAGEHFGTLGEALRYAAFAFSSGSEGIDPSRALTECAAHVDPEDLLDDPTAAIVVAVATARAGLAAGWSNPVLLDHLVPDLKIEPNGRSLLEHIANALRQNYVHQSGASPAAGQDSRESLGLEAVQLRDELRASTIVYERATRVLRRLLHADEPVGQALSAIEVWADGDDSAAPQMVRLLERMSSPKDIDRIIDHGDKAVASVSQRRNPITAKARTALVTKLNDVVRLLRDAITVSEHSRAGSSDSTADIRKTLSLLSETWPPFTGGGDIAGSSLSALARWIREPGAPLAEPGTTPEEVLAYASIPLDFVARDESGIPLLNGHDQHVIATALTAPKPRSSLLSSYIAKGDLETASRLASEPSEWSAIDEARRNWTGKLRAQVRHATERLAVVRSQHLLTPPDPDATVGTDADMESLLVSAAEPVGDRFDLAQASLRGLEQMLAARQAATVAELRERLEAITASAADRRRVDEVIAQNDLSTAVEFLFRLESGEALPSTGTAPSGTFEEFRGAVAAGTGRESATVFADLLGGPDVESPRTEPGVQAWGLLAQNRGAGRADHLRAVLRLLGLDVRGEPVDVTERGRSGFRTFRVQGTPVDGSFVPALGSRTSHYLVTVVTEQKDPRLTLDLIPKLERSGPNIILLPKAGVLSAQVRREYLVQARDQRVTALVVDSACVGYLAARGPGSFLTLQRLTLPYAIFPHYTPYLSGDVPDEVFVGREDEMAQITDPTGSIFVYGGRQLGKSALLRRVQRDFNRRAEHVAIFIDLKAHGIGERQEAGQLWSVLLEELKSRDLISKRITSAKPEAVTSAIRKWLDENADRRMLVLLDEADLFLESESRQRVVGGRAIRFANVGPLKSLMDATSRRFKPVFAGLHQVQRLQNVSNTPLAHGGRDVLIGPLSQPAARRLVLAPFEVLGYKFENLDLVWRLLSFTNYQPGLVQIVCEKLLSHLASRRPRNDEPPILVTATDVDTVMNDADVRSVVADRFRLTLNLEDRYLVTALTIAVMSVADRFHRHYPAAELLEACREKWPDGFDPLTTTEFTFLLEEMVGLGVLVRHSDATYALRSPNIVSMMGTRAQLEERLREGGFELPLEYNPRAARRVIDVRGGLPARRSPLSEEDLASVLPLLQGRGPVTVILGSPATGVDRVWDTLTAVAAERELQLEGLHLEEATRAMSSKSRNSLMTIRLEEAKGTEVGSAVTLLAGARGGGPGGIIILGATGVEALLSDGLERRVKLVPLRPWTEEGLRGWHDSPFGTAEQRSHLLTVSGGWPTLVERAMGQASAGESVDKVIDNLANFPTSSAESAAFLAAVGVRRPLLNELLTNWAMLADSGEALSDRDIAAAATLDDGARDYRTQFGRWLRELELLQIARATSDRWVLDVVVQRSIQGL
ncbi:hypothetical protein [Georgenia muralis]